MSDNKKIECSKFCKYYKHLFCPFSDDTSKIEESKELDPPPNTPTIPPPGTKLQNIEVTPYRIRTN